MAPAQNGHQPRLAGHRRAMRVEPSWQLRPRVGQVTRQFVQVDQRLRREHEVEAALKLLQAEPALGEVLVELLRKTFPVRVRRPRSPGLAAV